MSLKYLENFWIKIGLIVFSIFLLASWALRPISSSDFLSLQKNSLIDTSKSLGGIVLQGQNQVENLLGIIVQDTLGEKSIKDLDAVDGPFRAVIQMKVVDDEIQFEGEEVRNFELSYWVQADILDVVNEHFVDEGDLYPGYKVIQDPRGDNYFGRVFHVDGETWFAILDLHFMSHWFQGIGNLEAAPLVVNSQGELVFHSEISYIGSVYNQFETVNEKVKTENKINTLTVDERVLVLSSVGDLGLNVLLSASTWEGHFGYGFYFKLLLCGLAIMLLINFLAKHFTSGFSQTVSQGLGQFDESAKLRLKVEGLQREKESLMRRLNTANSEGQRSYSESDFAFNVKKNLFRLKSKIAGLVGQVQLLKNQENSENQIVESVDAKAKDLYKDLYNLLDDNLPEVMEQANVAPVKDENANLGIDQHEEVFQAPRNRSIDYGTEGLDFLENSKISAAEKKTPSILDRIESTKRDLDLDEVKVESPKMEKVELSQEEIDAQVELALQSQKAFKAPYSTYSIEQEFLNQQIDSSRDLSLKDTFEQQLKKIDSLIGSVEERPKGKDSTLDAIHFRRPKIES